MQNQPVQYVVLFLFRELVHSTLRLSCAILLTSVRVFVGTVVLHFSFLNSCGFFL